MFKKRTIPTPIRPTKTKEPEPNPDESGSGDAGIPDDRNFTRLSALKGPWTLQSNIIASAGLYQVESHLVVYLVCDVQLRGNKCSLGDECREIDDKVCLLEQENLHAHCHSMAEGVVDWSDSVLFFSSGVTVDSTAPFEIDTDGMSGWMGPYNVIMAKDYEMIGTTTSTGDTITDSYVIKYVTSPNTPYLKYPDDCTLLEFEDFDQYSGPTAVNNTVNGQVGFDFDSEEDPYAEYYDNCRKGNVKPLLPMMQFNFVTVNATNATGLETNETETESVEVVAKYKLLHFPEDDDYEEFVKVVEKQDVPMSGPYCWEKNPKKAFSFDFSYDSSAAQEQDAIKYYKACVNGLPCTPPAVINCNCTDGEEEYTDASAATTVEVGETIVMGLTAIGLTLVAMISIYYNYKNYNYLYVEERKLRKLLKRREQRESNTVTVMADSYDELPRNDSIGTDVDFWKKGENNDTDDTHAMQDETDSLTDPLLSQETTLDNK